MNNTEDYIRFERDVHYSLLRQEYDSLKVNNLATNV